MSLLKPTNRDANDAATASDRGRLRAGVKRTRSRRQSFHAAGHAAPSAHRPVLTTRRAAFLTWLSAAWLLALVLLGAFYVVIVAVARIG